MTIGEISRQSGIATSAIRYYERRGLLPKPPRQSGRRVYAPDILAKLAVVRFAKASGFRLREIRALFDSGRPYSPRLRAQAGAKIVEMDRRIEEATAMKALLRMALRCRCVDLDACGRLLAQQRRR